jgi:hypothetical protein
MKKLISIVLMGLLFVGCDRVTGSSIAEPDSIILYATEDTSGVLLFWEPTECQEFECYEVWYSNSGLYEPRTILGIIYEKENSSFYHFISPRGDPNWFWINTVNTAGSNMSNYIETRYYIELEIVPTGLGESFTTILWNPIPYDQCGSYYHITKGFLNYGHYVPDIEITLYDPSLCSYIIPCSGGNCVTISTEWHGETYSDTCMVEY